MTKVKEKGFTIIEVALVLAVAALIFLVVFLAVPALQRNQRDDARKRDVSMVVEAVTNYNANSGTALTAANVYTAGSSITTGLGPYITGLSNNVDYVNTFAPTFDTGGLFSFPASTVDAGSVSAAGNVPKLNNIIVYLTSQCNGNTGLKKGSSRQAAIVIQIENGGNSKFYCQNAS